MKKWTAFLLALAMCLSLCACGGGKAESTETATTAKETQDVESKSQEIVLDEPIVVLDNDTVKISITRFFTEYHNEGTENEYANSGFDADVENKMEEYRVDVSPENVSLSDQRVIEFAIGRSAPVAAGKIATYRFIALEHKVFEDLNALYELEGDFFVTVTDDNYSYSDLGGTYHFSIPESLQ